MRRVADRKSVSICGCRKEFWPRIDIDETRFRKPNQGIRSTAIVSSAPNAQRDDGNRFVVHADDKRTAFLELERAVCIHLLSGQC